MVSIKDLCCELGSLPLLVNGRTFSVKALSGLERDCVRRWCPGPVKPESSDALVLQSWSIVHTLWLAKAMRVEAAMAIGLEVDGQEAPVVKGGVLSGESWAAKAAEMMGALPESVAVAIWSKSEDVGAKMLDKIEEVRGNSSAPGGAAPSSSC